MEDTHLAVTSLVMEAKTPNSTVNVTFIMDTRNAFLPPLPTYMYAPSVASLPS